ncbi:MAG: class I SAM-dependent methyltransferase [Candidatus Altiarchaeota archaeon]|nr:class I SAM-dependent methyltransferase [Candidatus Altiarchaeota archaeon]
MPRDWDNIYKTRGDIFGEPERVIKQSVELLKQNSAKKILDLGCGTGRHSLLLAKEGFEVYGLDTSPNALQILRDKAKKEGVKIKLDEGDMCALPYKGSFFDAIISTQVIQHGLPKDIKKTASEIDRVLKPGGFIVIKTLSAKNEMPRDRVLVEERTVKGGDEGEEDVPHHYFMLEELEGLFRGYGFLKLENVEEWSRMAKGRRWFVELVCRKPG